MFLRLEENTLHFDQPVLDQHMDFDQIWRKIRFCINYFLLDWVVSGPKQTILVSFVAKAQYYFPFTFPSSCFLEQRSRNGLCACIFTSWVIVKISVHRPKELFLITVSFNKYSNFEYNIMRYIDNAWRINCIKLRNVRLLVLILMIKLTQSILTMVCAQARWPLGDTFFKYRSTNKVWCDAFCTHSSTGNVWC